MNTKQEADVSVKIRTIIATNGEKQEAELSAVGRLFTKSHGYYLQFQENDNELGVVTQVVNIKDDNTVTVIRQGAVSMKQLFTEEKETESVYRTQFATMLMKVNTTDVRINIDQKQPAGEIFLRYQLYVENELSGSYEVKITFGRKIHEYG